MYNLLFWLLLIANIKTRNEKNHLSKQFTEKKKSKLYCSIQHLLFFLFLFLFRCLNQVYVFHMYTPLQVVHHHPPCQNHLPFPSTHTSTLCVEGYHRPRTCKQCLGHSKCLPFATNCAYVILREWTEYLDHRIPIHHFSQ